MKCFASDKATVFRRIGSIDLVIADTRRVALWQLLRDLSSAERRQWRAIRARKMATLFLASRAMALPMAQLLNKPNRRVIRLSSGQPVLRKGFISISRCYPFVVFALAQKPVGVDLELIRGDDDLINAVAPLFSPEEQSIIRKSAARPSSFCWVWSRKEALVKRDGAGICADLAAFDTLQPRIGLRSFQLRGKYWLSVAG